ncbi:nucleotide disphospho-sugar-binding domain-containing protein [Uliginosibacterium sp. H3]|uniref:Nucleotide disphospho-sugar-binding domain-containing protein n=1 Tax=Uliginosibacterium silvisoli TaxID=3114758 RepID=A0ABU6JZG4_9RHOO|nr:nucleotide disphospho-sugar-binding domain-containing protein [Uliginosibacterium sp. H3]
MHVLIEAVGSAGDVHPFLAIGQALVARGHEVDIVTSAYFAERVAQAGLGFIPVGTLEDYQRAIAQTDLWHPRRAFQAVWRESKDQILPVFELLQQNIRRDTVLVGSTLAWSVRFAQERLSLPAATVHLSPSCVFSADAPPRLPGLGHWLEYLPVGWRRMFLNWMERKFLDGVVRDDLNVMRGQIGLSPVEKVFSRWQHSPQSVICAWPEWFCAPQADWPVNSITTGFPLWQAVSNPPAADIEPEVPSFPPALRTAKLHDAPLARVRERGWGRGLERESSGVDTGSLTPLDSRFRGNDGLIERHVNKLPRTLEEFLTAGEAPIGFTPGSAMAFGKPFFERALSACEQLGRRAVFITPFDEQMPWHGGTMPAFVHHARYVPFDALVPRLAAFVHHGGIGTTAQTLHAGVPQLITPFAHDQFDNAARVARLGCGAQLAATASADKWAAVLGRLLDDEGVSAACQRVRASMADEAGVLAQIVARIEALHQN